MDITLGFGSIPRPQYVFVSREPDYCWYMLSDEKKQIPIYDKALTGTITGIEVEKPVKTSYGTSLKTDLYILADKSYVVRSGSDSYFSKRLLLSLDALTYEQLQHPLAITVEPGEQKVVFCTIYNPFNYRAVDVSWNEHKEIDWQVLGQRVSLKINQERTNERDSWIAQTDRYLAQLNWTAEQGREYLQHKYGKRSRLQLNDAELLEFMDFLKLQPQCA